jgi:hypothetical protein
MSGINTSGFRASVMPQYTAPNPSLVAFNPVAASDGMMQAFQLAKQYEALKAHKALQAELAATREGRINSQNSLAGLDVARAGSEIGLMPDSDASKRATFQANVMTAIPEADFKLTSMKEKLRAMPSLTDESISNAEFNVAKNLENSVNLGDIARAEGLRARATQTDAQRAIDLGPLVTGAERARLGFDTTKANLGTAMLPMQNQLEAFRIGDLMGNAGEDAKRGRATRDMDLLLKQSQLMENLGRAEYYQEGGRAGSKPNYANQIAALQLAKKRLEDSDYVDASGAKVKGLAAYRASTRDDRGNIRTTNPGWMPDILTPDSKEQPVRQDPEGEAAIKQSKAFEDAIARLLPLLSQDVSGGAIPSMAPPSIAIPETHKAYLKANASNPKVRADFDAKYGKGAADQILR